MEEMNATVLEVARNSGEAASVGNEAKDRAVSGRAVVASSIEAMETTRKQAEELRLNMNVLGEKAEAIGAIMTVIEDIADQTNLLALNAAIEAARAGEAGRGFAVVADEVRKLAEKTMGATKEVGDSIRAIQSAAAENIDSMGKAVADLAQAVELSNQSGVVLDEIVQRVERSAEQIQSIATAAEEQSATSEEINRAIDEINRITGDTARGVSESAAALSELAGQMSELAALIQELKQDGSDGLA
jgi:methyl-accepting chemotaxis protein